MNTYQIEMVDDLIRTELDVRPIYSRRRSRKPCAALIRLMKVIQFCRSSQSFEGVEITTVLVDQSHRGQGFGKELMKSAFKN